MRVVGVLERLGGVAARGTLIRATSRSEVDRALKLELIQALAHGRYAVPAVEVAEAAAHRVSGVLSLVSAALHHGWEVKSVPAEPHVTVRRSRTLTPLAREGIQIHAHVNRRAEVDCSRCGAA